jgi:hypothetical protein
MVFHRRLGRWELARVRPMAQWAPVSAKLTSASDIINDWHERFACDSAKNIDHCNGGFEAVVESPNLKVTRIY